MEDLNLSGKEAMNKLKAMIKEASVAMVCTRGPHGRPESRPIARTYLDEEGILWFFTNDHPEKDKQYQSEHGLCLCYSQPASKLYVSVSGKALIVKDPAREKQLWNDFSEAWFSDGLDDPYIRLVRVAPARAEYWDNAENKMKVFFKMPKPTIPMRR